MAAPAKRFTQAIAEALHKASANGVQVKKVARWTGANERTVKNWFAGRYGPSGDHLIVLAQHCNEVALAVLVAIGRSDVLMSGEFQDIERRIEKLIGLLDELKRH